MSALGRAAMPALIVFGLLAGPAWAAGTAEETAKAFCATRITGDNEAVKPLLTPSLLAEVNEAERRNDVIQKANPDEKPPFGDGIPYQSFPDTPSACTVVGVAEKAGKFEAGVKYTFTEYPDAAWTDTLVLVAAGGGYLIDDIRFVGAADGSPEVVLRDILKHAFDQ